MRTKFLLAIITTATVLSGCETSNTYMKVADGPDYGYARARCSTEAAGTRRSFYASGSIGYVIGASVGSAVINEIRYQEYMKNCMVMQGWQNVPKAKAGATNVQIAKHRNAQGRSFRTENGSTGRPPKQIVAGM